MVSKILRSKVILKPLRKYLPLLKHNENEVKSNSNKMKPIELIDGYFFNLKIT